MLKNTSESTLQSVHELVTQGELGPDAFSEAIVRVAHAKFPEVRAHIAEATMRETKQ